MVTKPIDGQPAHHANGGTIGFNFDSPEEVDAWHRRGVERAAGDRGFAGYRECSSASSTSPICAIRTATSSAGFTGPSSEPRDRLRKQGARRTAAGRPSRVRVDLDRHDLLDLPAAASGGGRKLPVLWYLSGLTCTHANVTEKGEYRAACAEHGLIFVAPDTSPRGDDVPDGEDYDFGKGAGFYVDATRGTLGGELPDVDLCHR